MQNPLKEETADPEKAKKQLCRKGKLWVMLRN